MSLLSWLGKKDATEQHDATSTQPGSKEGSSTAWMGEYRIVQRKDGRFNIVSSKGSISTRKTRSLAEDYIIELINDGQPDAPTAPAPTRRSSRPQQSMPSTPLEPRKTTNAGRPLGNRNKKRKEPDATNPEDALMDFLNANPAAKRSKHGDMSASCANALKQMRTDHEHLKKI